MRKLNNSFPGESEFDYFPVVLFPMAQMKILPYNRVIKSVTAENIAALTELGLEPSDQKSPNEKGFISMYYDGQWWSLKLPTPTDNDVVSTLDVARLQNHILQPIFGIENPRTDKRINFVGGIRGTDELEKLVKTGDYELAISMYPTSIQELVDVSDEGELMPPKSTWFEPKIKSGFIIHTF
jgi:uncharacterized protein (DUF1015 family)